MIIDILAAVFSSYVIFRIEQFSVKQEKLISEVEKLKYRHGLHVVRPANADSK